MSMAYNGLINGLTDPEKHAIELACVQKLRSLAATELGKPDTELVVRDVLPDTDLDWNGGTTEIWDTTNTASVAYQTTPAANAIALATDQYLGVYGFANTGTPQAVSLARFRTGTSTTRDIWDIQTLYARWEEIGYGPVVVWKRAEKVDITFYFNTTAAGTTKLKPLTKICEPKGKNINPV